MNSFYILLITSFAATVTRIPETGTPPVRRLYSLSVNFKNNLYTFGGNSSITGNLNDLHIFSPEYNIWSKIEPIDGVKPLARIVFAMYTTDRHIYIHGGLGNNGQLSDMWRFDVPSTTWSRVDQQGEIPPPFYRSGFADFTHNDTRYFALSCFGTRSQSATNDLYVFNSETETWQLMPKVAKEGHEVPEARRLWNLNYYDGFIYLWGGNILEKAEQLYRYDLERQQWELVQVEGATPTFRTFFRSVVYKDSLIIFPGWKEDEGIDVDDYWKFDFNQLQSTSTPKWQELQIDRSGNYANFLPRDSYALSLIDNLAYLHAGYSNTQPTGNFLISINLDSNTLTWDIIGKNYDSLSSRYFHTMTVIQGKFYVYGGSTGEVTLDELWIYDELKGTWELKEAIGTSPGPRMGHAAVSIGHNLIIFGGRNESTYYNDMYSYNSLTNTWETMPVRGIAMPARVEGSCMLSHGDDIYIFGGNGDFKSNNQLWKFSLATKTYTQQAIDSYLAPDPVTQSSCFEMDGNLYFMYGMDDNTANTPKISIFNLSTLKWSEYEQEVPNGHGLSAVAAANVGNIVVSASGSRYNNRCYGKVYMMNFDTGEFIQETTLDWAAYAEAQVYYKNSMYVFGGGGSSPDGAIHRTLSMDRFYKITFEDLPCSQGTYRVDGECIPCPAGTYKSNLEDDFWTDWPSGMYNDNIAAPSFNTWLPCPEDYYNDKPGQPFCFKCVESSYCPVGTIQPYATQLNQSQYFDEQPDVFTPETETINTNIRYALLALATVIVLLILGLLISKQFKRLIPALDFFTQRHAYTVNEIMSTKQTFLGGLVTCFAICILFYLTTQTLLHFFYDNVIEKKTLLPIVVMRDEVRGNIEVTITFNDYGGECVQSDGSCAPEIRFLTYNLSGKLSQVECTKLISQRSCLIKRRCEKCRLEKDSNLLVSSFEEQAFAAVLTVSVTSDSSIPDEDSSMEYSMKADPRQVFRGSDASKFHFFMIPSVFESEVSHEPDEETGYHLSQGDHMEPGSQSSVENMTKYRFLHVRIDFSQGETALKTKRIYKLTDNTLILAIIGGIAGVLQFGVLILRFIERRYEKIMKKWLLEKKKEKFANNRYIDTDMIGHQMNEIPQVGQNKVAPFNGNPNTTRNNTTIFDEDNTSCDPKIDNTNTSGTLRTNRVKFKSSFWDFSLAYLKRNGHRSDK